MNLQKPVSVRGNFWNGIKAHRKGGEVTSAEAPSIPSESTRVQHLQAIVVKWLVQRPQVFQLSPPGFYTWNHGKVISAEVTSIPIESTGFNTWNRAGAPSIQIESTFI